MRRRRRFLLVAVVGAGAVLVLLGRCGGGPDPAPPRADLPGDRDPVAAPAPARGSPASGAPPAGSPPGSPAAAAAASPSPVPVVTDGGVAGSEALDPAEVPAAVQAAERFAAAWADPAPGWYDRVAALATGRLAAALAGADPPRPGPEITGPGQLQHGAPQWARVGVPAVRGTLVLDLVATGAAWLVSAVDWWPA